MTANVITYRGKSAAREVGKALDLDEGQIDRLAKVMHQFEFIDPADTLSKKLAEVGMAGDEPRVRHFAALWRQMQDLPRHLGQHSGGMVVCQGDLSSVVPLENASMPGRVVVQWDKEDCADMGIIKVDLLNCHSVLNNLFSLSPLCPLWLTSNCTRHLRSAFCAPRRRRRRSSSAPPCSATRRSRCSIATASRARRGFIKPPSPPASAR